MEVFQPAEELSLRDDWEPRLLPHHPSPFPTSSSFSLLGSTYRKSVTDSVDVRARNFDGNACFRDTGRERKRALRQVGFETTEEKRKNSLHDDESDEEEGDESRSENGDHSFGRQSQGHHSEPAEAPPAETE